MAAIGANPLFIVGGVGSLAALVVSLLVQCVILQQGHRLVFDGPRGSRRRLAQSCPSLKASAPRYPPQAA